MIEIRTLVHQKINFLSKMEENTTKLKNKSSNKRKEKKLPWWIELLFVQVGLPESLLVKYLNLEKKVKLHIEAKKDSYKVILLIGIIMIYFYPIIEESRQRNSCRNLTLEKLNDKKPKSVAKAIAINYCNGGGSYDLLD